MLHLQDRCLKYTVGVLYPLYKNRNWFLLHRITFNMHKMQLFFEKYPFVGENTLYKNAYIYFFLQRLILFYFILFYFIFCFHVKTQLQISFLKYILLIMKLQLSYPPPTWLYSPLPCISLPTHIPFPLSSCPWVIHISSLVSPFLILFLTSPCLLFAY